MIRNAVRPYYKVDDIVWSMWRHIVGYNPRVELTTPPEHKRSEFNSKLWNSTTDDNSPQRKQARMQKRRLKYHSNILVIKDSAHPENEGKVFLYSYGKKIFDKLRDLMNPQFEDEKPVNPFDFWAGADFRLKVRKVEGYINYDKSEFDSPSALFDGDDDKLKEVYENLNSLQALIAPDQFDSYAELEARLHKVLGINGSDKATESVGETKSADNMIDADLDMSKIGKSDDAPEISETASGDSTNASADDDDDLEFFRGLASS